MATWDTTRNVSGHLAFSNANQDVTYTGTAGTDSCAFSTNFQLTGKWICRFNIVALVAGYTGIGFGDGSASSAGNQYLGIDTHSLSFAGGGNWVINNTFTASGSSAAGTGDLIDIAIDLGAQLAWFNQFRYVDGNNGTGDPVAGTNGFSISALASFTLSPACDLMEAAQTI